MGALLKMIVVPGLLSVATITAIANTAVAQVVPILTSLGLITAAAL